MMKSKSELCNEMLNSCESLKIREKEEVPVVYRDIARKRERE